MPTPQLAQQILQAVNELGQIDLKRVLRTELGELAAYDEFHAQLENLFQRIESIRNQIAEVSNQAGQNFLDALRNLTNNLRAMADAAPADFVRDRVSLTDQVRAASDAVLQALFPFLILKHEAIVNPSIGSSDATELVSIREEIDKNARETIAKLATDAEKIISEAVEKANAIQNTARDTASGVSVLGTRISFSQLTSRFVRGMQLSAAASGVGFIVFILLIIYWIEYPPPDTEKLGLALFYTSIRLAALGATAAIIGFLLKIFRENLNMYYHTLHRQQLTDSIQSFVDAARTEEQRDIIFGKLVEAVATFGSSGLMGPGDDSPSTLKIGIEAIPKLLGEHKT